MHIAARSRDADTIEYDSYAWSELASSQIRQTVLRNHKRVPSILGIVPVSVVACAVHSAVAV